MICTPKITNLSGLAKLGRSFFDYLIETHFLKQYRFHGHFIGINANYTQFNISGMPMPNLFVNLCTNAPSPESFCDARIAGWAVGAGLTYGYQFLISPRWNLELTAGLGWWYTEYDRFESRKCGMFEQAVYKHALGPTSLGVSFIYLIK